ncbi:MAG: 5'/3'-nucleotidase SurE [Candidatus Theseobacter exili]|nr:5'/3'-nucleotidase SurE [Candidatus Theseobacter exili]
MKKTILLTNDDGIQAEGLAVLRDTLAPLADIIVVAPETEQSATSHSITLHEPLRIREVRKAGALWGYAVKGRPVDCVKIAVRALMDKHPDVIVSGINPGPNLGISVLYSGTVAAALEGAALDIPSVAVSLDERQNPDFGIAAAFAKTIVKSIIEHGCPSEIALNVNVPSPVDGKIKGLLMTRQGRAQFIETLDRRFDPRELAYYWLGGDMVELEEDENVDYVAHRNGYVSITPLRADLTDYKVLDNFDKLFFFNEKA